MRPPLTALLLLPVAVAACGGARSPNPTACQAGPAALTGRVNQRIAFRPWLVWSDGPVASPDSTSAELTPAAEWSGPEGEGTGRTWYLTAASAGNYEVRVRCFLGTVSLSAPAVTVSITGN